MTASRIISMLLIAGALAALAVEVVGSIRAGGYESIAVADAWFRINSNSLVGFGALIENRVSPDLWSEVLLPLLALPLWLVLAVPGALLAIVSRRRRRRHGLSNRRL